MISALTGGHFHPAALLWIDWPGDPLFAHSGAGTMTWAGHGLTGVTNNQWLGANSVGSLEIPGEGDGLSASPATVVLNGPPDALMEMMADPIRDRECRMWAAVTTRAGGNVLLAEPTLVFSGTADTRRFQAAREGMAYTHQLRIEFVPGPPIRQSSARYHSLEEHQRTHPSDTGFRLLATLEREIKTREFPAKD